VAALVASSSEYQEGLAPGDLIISLNGKSVFNVETLRKLLGESQTGNSVVLQVQREDQLRFVVFELP
jgi:S1-C subfamily serine protease